MSSSLTLNLSPVLQLTDEQFEQLAKANQNLRLELTAKGELIIMPPTGGETGNRNFELYLDLGNWNRRTLLGKAFDSSTGFLLPNGARRSPDVSWITQAKWESLTTAQKKKFLPLCPDFAIELVSETDEIETSRQKMREYLDNGLLLGWLIIPESKTVEIYRQNHDVEILIAPIYLSGEAILPELVVDLTPIWAI